MKLPPADDTRSLVALVLAGTMGFAIVVIAVAVLVTSAKSPETPLSDNATQLLTATFSGVIGLLGGYLGYRAGYRAGQNGGGDADGGEADDDGA